MLYSLDGQTDSPLPQSPNAPELIGLETLPLDIIMLIVALLEIQDIYRLRQVRYLSTVRSPHAYWYVYSAPSISRSSSRPILFGTPRYRNTSALTSPSFPSMRQHSNSLQKTWAVL